MCDIVHNNHWFTSVRTHLMRGFSGILWQIQTHFVLINVVFFNQAAGFQYVPPGCTASLAVNECFRGSFCSKLLSLLIGICTVHKCIFVLPRSTVYPYDDCEISQRVVDNCQSSVMHRTGSISNLNIDSSQTQSHKVLGNAGVSQLSSLIHN